MSFDDGTWAVTTPDGRFDTNDLEHGRNLHWVLPDDPFHPLPLTVFERQYYEPRLLARILAGEKLPPLPSIGDLNRVQPNVSIASATPQTGADGMVAVTVKIERGQGTAIQDGKEIALTSASKRTTAGWKPGATSGVFDLRLFRNGQLIGSQDGEVAVGADGTATVTFPHVRLPSNSDAKSVMFSAYAFNVDRVRSEIDQRGYALQKTASLPAKGRAYIICMGVNASQTPRLSLRFAVNDADRMAHALSANLKRSGDYGEPITVELTAPTNATEDTVTAHKADLRVVFDRLAGHILSPADVARLARIPNANRLNTSTPDDLVIISFSGHGEAGLAANPAEYGRFYFVPYDIGADFDASAADLKKRSESLARCVSSDELSRWLHDVDAGQMALVVDACHSAAAVQAGDFKPGPMGARGLGQLAYDKGMRVLAASQADDFALEDANLQQGLLSYALVHHGLTLGQADWKPKDGQITLSEWLAFGADDVPQLYNDIKEQRIPRGAANGFAGSNRSVELITLGSASSNGDPARTRPDLQQPQLFDFNRYQSDPVIGHVVAKATTGQ